MKDKARELFDEAVQKLRAANDELCRPEEDVVTALVCSNAHTAIEKYLQGFLVLHAINPSPDASIEGLYEQCKNLNKHFEEVHLSGYQCRAYKEESRFGNKASNYSRCFDIADSLDTFLRRERILA